jgi:23S rRNA pseudouridine1911/1915/1917 synthase
MSRRKKSPQKIHVLFEDDSIIGVNKPPGLLAVPIPKSSADNLEDRVKQYVRGQQQQAQAVHRIDRYTSGVMIFSKRREVHQALVDQFRNLEPERRYIAIVRGQPKDEGTLEHHLKRIKKGFRNVVVSPDNPKGTLARLHYLTLERFPQDDVAIIEVSLDTGLKNQIRVQLAETGHPLVGDRHYSPKEKQESRINRQALHALEVILEHPQTGRDITIRAPFPKDLKRLMSQLS